MLISRQYPYYDVVLSIGTWSLVESAYLDTGHEGGLLIPEYISDDIVTPSTPTPLRMPDGGLVWAPAWTGIVEIDGLECRAEVAALGSRFLLGREVLDRLLVCFDRGREVRVEV